MRTPLNPRDAVHLKTTVAADILHCAGRLLGAQLERMSVRSVPECDLRTSHSRQNLHPLADGTTGAVRNKVVTYFTQPGMNTQRRLLLSLTHRLSGARHWGSEYMDVCSGVHATVKHPGRDAGLTNIFCPF